MNKLKAIQGVVIILTSLIILGIGLVVYGLFNRGKETASENIIDTKSINIPETIISEPRGSIFSEIQSCGENICLRVRGGEENERIIILSSQGYVIRKIRLDFSD